MMNNFFICRYLHQLEYASILCKRDFDEDFNTDILNLEVFHYMMNVKNLVILYFNNNY